MWFATLVVFLALLYVVFPLDFDFVPVVGRIDDIIIVCLAAYYYWKRKKIIDAMAGAGPRRERPAGEPGRKPPREDQDGGDPYRLLGVDPGDDEGTIKKAYRELLGKYHPDRVQHLGEEFREMAARRTRALTRAWQEIRRSRNFS